MLEKLGFKYKQEVDPFDGGPHLGVKTKDVKIIKEMKCYKAKRGAITQFKKPALVGLVREDRYLGGNSSFELEGNEIFFPEATWTALELEEGENVCLSQV